MRQPLRLLRAAAGLWLVGAVLAAPLPARADPNALPVHTMQWQALAERIVAQLQLEPGERVISLGHPGKFEALIPHLRYAVIKAGGTDLGVLDTLQEPFPDNWDTELLNAGFARARTDFVDLLRDVDAAIMLPGANPTQPAYAALQMLLFNEGGPRRTIHFHWTDAYSSSGNLYGLMGVTVLPGHPPPPMQVIDRVYQRAVLETDLEALAASQAEFAAAIKDAEVRITSPAGTDLRFRVGGRDIIQQNGDASAARMRAGAAFLTREVEIPAGVVRVAPLESTVNGVVVLPYSAWHGRSVSNARIRFTEGRITALNADSGAEHLRAELEQAPAEARQFREFGLGFNPLLTVPEDNASWIPYFGYGAGIVRVGFGNNFELGGAVRGNYFRWRDFLTDATVSVDGTVWVERGTLLR
ncbi:MAG: aminopeptidase [Gammaproteobacteria bacterium]|nr:aminopeptidase [Gammaproteobacteria bacterium]